MSASWQQKYEDLQREFESFKQHSSDFERELETELTASQKENEKLKDKVSRLEHTLAQAQQRMDGELNRARSECAALQVSL
jgi:predicted  nucleic acid-binding Zn-ribbon protein